MMNILVTYISTMRNNEESNFGTNNLCEKETIASRQTNETAIRCLDLMLKEKSETLDRIICILSESAYADITKGAEGLSAYNYLKDVRCEDLNSKPEFVEIFIYDENGMEKTDGRIISELCDCIGNDTVYIDTTGGPRNALNLIQLLTKILKYKGVNNPCSFYSNIQGSEKYIETTDEINVMMDIADAVNEFVHSGKSSQLIRLFESETNKDVKKLLKDMNDFSESIQLCSLDKLDTILESLGQSIKAVYQIVSDDMKIVILKNLLTVIEDKFFKHSTNSIDYCSVVEWCLENGLIQQAITVYIEKMPSYIFANNIISVSKNLYTDIKIKGSNPDATVFYDKIMDSVAGDRKLKTDELLNVIKFRKSKIKTTDKNKEIIEAINLIEHESKNMDFRRYIQKELRKNNTGAKAILINEAASEGWKTFDGMINSINRIAAKLLELPDEKESTFDKKIRTAFEITNKNIVSGAEINSRLAIEDVRRIMLDYIYVKALRNQINHASAEENLTEEQNKILEDNGYLMKRTITDVKSNLNKSINLIRMLAAKTGEE